MMITVVIIVIYDDDVRVLYLVLKAMLQLIFE